MKQIDNYKNKQLKDILKNKKLPFTFEYVSALSCSSGKRSDCFSNLKVIALSGDKAFCELSNQKNNAVIMDLSSKFRIQNKKKT